MQCPLLLLWAPQNDIPPCALATPRRSWRAIEQKAYSLLVPVYLPSCRPAVAALTNTQQVGLRKHSSIIVVQIMQQYSNATSSSLVGPHSMLCSALLRSGKKEKEILFEPRGTLPGPYMRYSTFT